MTLLKPLPLLCSAAALAALTSACAFASAEAETNLFNPAPSTSVQTAASKVERMTPLGPLTEVSEPDILEAFKRRVEQMRRSGEYDKRFQQNKQRIASELERPTPVEGLKKAQGLEIAPIEASIPEKLPAALALNAQNLPVGEFSRPLLFIDGEDEESLKAAAKIIYALPNTRVVLVNGAPREVSEILDRRIFFDQGGALTRLFAIQSVPALLFNEPEGPAKAEFAPSSAADLLRQIPS